MICDNLKNCAAYEAMGPAFQKAFAYLKTVTPDNLPGSRLELDGDKLFAFSSSYETLPASQRKIEAHRNYLDIQYVVSGAEAMGYIPTEGLAVSETYKPDVEFFATDKDVLIPAEAGTFMIFFPQDAHRPGCTWKEPSQVTKVVVKIAL
ncbi:MAG: YhcH/YjgK/YiaL family protein [Clostridia bacterium]|nr:YhcH/YjgK/YiaL family protein [Clostridia bacterium]